MNEVKTYNLKEILKEASKYLNFRDMTFYKRNQNIISYAYIAEKGYGVEVVVKDGKESEEYIRVDNLMYFPDGKSFVYTAEENGKRFVVKD